MTDDKRRLLCVPSHRRVPEEFAPGTTFTQYGCMLCGQKVCVAPSSQEYIAQHPDTEIVCVLCFEPKPDDTIETAPGSVQELTDFFKKRAH